MEQSTHRRRSRNGGAASFALSIATDQSSEGFLLRNDDEETAVALAAQETKAVWRMRMLMLVVLLLSAAGLAVGVYFYAHSFEQQLFETKFREESETVVFAIAHTMDLTLGGIDALAVGLVSFAKATNQTWPFVTVPDFAVRAAKTLSLTKALYINTYTYVHSKEMRSDWEAYSAEYGPPMVQETFATQEEEGIFTDMDKNVSYFNVIFNSSEYKLPKDEQGTVGLDPNDPGPFLPMWQTFPQVPGDGPYNWDLLSERHNRSIVEVLEAHEVSITEAYLIPYPNETEEDVQDRIFGANFLERYLPPGENPMEPASDIYIPILLDAADAITSSARQDGYDPAENKLGGFVATTIYWRDMLRDILPDGSVGIRIVFENECSPPFTYQINGPEVEYLGVGDFVEPEFDYLGWSTNVSTLQGFLEAGARPYTGVPLNSQSCPFVIRIYPSTVMYNSIATPRPTVAAVFVVVVFAFTGLVFFCYDLMVERRQRVIHAHATKNHAVVANLFPSVVRDRMLVEKVGQKRQRPSSLSKSGAGLPIADLYSEATVLFGDLAGFTAWSSTREPTQVFVLLETLYASFDAIAKRRGVFKIETIGDCYVAVVGLPDPRKHHAVVMARFAADCRDEMREQTRKLETNLGPGTADLKLRVGLDSGAVTAGVLRGEKSRFQLFGDTVNTAARMESNGTPDRIHVSESTADRLFQAGKDNWMSKREDMITAKGKGKMQTYWVEPRGGLSSHGQVDEFIERSELLRGAELMKSNKEVLLAEKLDRLIDWTVGVIDEALRHLVAHRQNSPHSIIRPSFTRQAPMGRHSLMTSVNRHSSARLSTMITSRVEWSRPVNGSITLDEVADCIPLEPFQQRKNWADPESIELPSEVLSQLHDYVSLIAHSYRPNAFHNYDRCCHVMMSTKKLLNRITDARHMRREEAHSKSLGLASDPLAQLAVLFAGLVHDVDNPGISNSLLMKEDAHLASHYKHRCIAEQNSLDISWNLLMDPAYDALRSAIFTNTDELKRFRQWLVNCVLCTDLLDLEFKRLRGKRWEQAFAESAKGSDPDAMNRKATIFVESVAQAGDLCHYMQHWTIYLQWSRSLFQEMYGAYLAGRSDMDPTVAWYEQELQMFDSIVIPLATRLADSKVFDNTASRELCQCAKDNRIEWEAKGAQLVEAMKDEFGSSAVVEI